MSKRVIGLVLSLLGSVGIGVLAAQKFFALFDKTVPAGSMTDLVRTGTHAAYITSGIVFGIFYRDVKHLLYLAAVAAYFLTAYSAIWVGKSHDAPYIFLSIAAFIGIIYFVWTRFEFLNAGKTPTPKTAYFDDILDA